MDSKKVSSIKLDTKQKMNLGKFFFFFTGRIDRETFWILSLLVIFINLILFLPSKELKEAPIIWLVTLLEVWVSLAIQAKRWHDRDKSALMILINFIPVFGWIWTLVELGFLKGTIGLNKYGDDPQS